MSTKESFSRWGIVFAGLGMAVGTGNLWRFPRIASQYGGGAFMIAWIFFLLVWALPLLVIELSVGKHTRMGVVGSFGKMIGNFIFMGVVAALMVPLFSVLFSISLFVPLIPAVLALGILGYAGVGTLISSLAVHSRGREVMLPILLLPIALSILIPAVRATRGLLEGREWVDLAVWFQLLIATNVIYIALAYMLFDYVVEE